MNEQIETYIKLLGLAISLGERGASLVKHIREIAHADGITDEQLDAAHAANQATFPDPLAAELPPAPEPSPEPDPAPGAGQHEYWTVEYPDLTAYQPTDVLYRATDEPRKYVVLPAGYLAFPHTEKIGTVEDLLGLP